MAHEERRRATRSGLFWALFVVIGAVGLLAAVVDAVIGPRDALTACVTLGAVSLVVLGSYAYRRARDGGTVPGNPAVAESPAGARLTNAQFLAVEALWAIILIAAVAAIAIAEGPKRAAFGVPAAMAVAALMVLEWRRRRAHGSE